MSFELRASKIPNTPLKLHEPSLFACSSRAKCLSTFPRPSRLFNQALIKIYVRLVILPNLFSCQISSS